MKNNIARWLLAMLIVFFVSKSHIAFSQNFTLNTNFTDAEGGFPIRMKYDPLLNPLPLIQASINDSKPLTFVVDTGLNGILLLDEKVAKSLNLIKNNSSIKIPGSRQVFRAVKLDTFTIPGQDTSHLLRIGSFQAYAGNMDLPNSITADSDVCGVIGTPMLEHFAIRFDFSARLMTFLFRPLADVPSLVSLPMSENNGVYDISLTLPGQPSTSLMLDTGANLTIMPLIAIGDPDLFASTEAKGQNIAGTYKTKKVLLPTLKIGDFAESDVIVNVTSQRPMLGMNVLSRFRCTFDFPGRRLLLERASDYPMQVRQPGAKGLKIAKSSKGYVVKTVKGDSPEEKAGIRQGDNLIQVDGQPVSTLPLQAVYNLLNGFADTPAELILARNGKDDIRASYIRISEFAKGKSKY